MPENGERDPDFRFQCQDCIFGSHTPLGISQHEYHHRRPGMNQDLYYCIVCDEDFQKEEELHAHHRDMHDNMVYYCRLCTRKFRKQRFAQYILHLQQKHNIEYRSSGKQVHVCAHCGHTHSVK